MVHILQVVQYVQAPCLAGVCLYQRYYLVLVYSSKRIQRHPYHQQDLQPDQLPGAYHHIFQWCILCCEWAKNAVQIHTTGHHRFWQDSIGAASRLFREAVHLLLVARGPGMC